MDKIEKIGKGTLRTIKNNFTFYDFEELESVDNSGFIVEFQKQIEIITYSDIQFTSKLEIFELNARKIIELIEAFLENTDDEFCILVKYNDVWVVDVEKSTELSSIFEKHKLHNDYDGGLKISKNSKLLNLFIKAALKYNSFVQIILVDSKFIISPTDHMDIFFNSNYIKYLEAKLTAVLDKPKAKDFSLRTLF